MSWQYGRLSVIVGSPQFNLYFDDTRRTVGSVFVYRAYDPKRRTCGSVSPDLVVALRSVTLSEWLFLTKMFMQEA